MAAVCRQVYGIFDSSKVERFGTHPFLPVERITALISDTGVPTDHQQEWTDAGVTLGPRRPRRLPTRPGRRAAAHDRRKRESHRRRRRPRRRERPGRAGRLRRRAPRADVVHRFTHTPREVDGVLRWNLATLDPGGIRRGLATLADGDTEIASVGVDAWGVDYGLLDANGGLVDEPTCYRDGRQVVAYGRGPRHGRRPPPVPRPPASSSSRSTPCSPSPPTPPPPRSASRPRRAC